MTSSTPANRRQPLGASAPDLVVIGAMKCGTSALHALLDHHPDVAMSQPKELNFFIGPAAPPAGPRAWTTGNWARGTAWYAGHFPAGVRVRGESSPGYTSPDHPEAAARMAAVIPGARLVYLVRDPIDRALSQYRHHHAEGGERRPPAAALLDPASQYIARSRYHERLLPFLAHFPRSRILIVAQEDLRARPRDVLRRVFAFAGVDDAFWCDAYDARPRPDRATAALDGDLRARLAAALRDDVARLRTLVDHPLPATWTL